MAIVNHSSPSSCVRNHGLPDLFVCCSRHGNNGVLYKLHFSVRPTVLSPMRTEDCTGLWTLYDNTSLGVILVQSHGYMIFTDDVADDVDNYKEAPGPISTATVLDNYVLFLMNDGHIHLLSGGDAYNMRINN
ncbi:hypothetical protein Tco_0785352 [Tanacetum coccineum]